MLLEIVCVGELQVNCYILASKEGAGAIIIDPGSQPDKIKEVLLRHKLKPAFIINTHGHFDHIGADDDFDVPVLVHCKDAPLLKDPYLNLSAFFSSAAVSVASEMREVKNHEIIALDDIALEVLEVPGHSPGGMALLLKSPHTNMVFTGDSLFFQSIGRTDFPGASGAMLIDAIKKNLLTLPNDTVVYPGHGPSSTIGQEKSGNQFFFDA
ncbi:MAG: MBL fold metallo-hydrolase [Candidatus Omnitrophota bacterium]|jgi:glyoxylase-like metal-dependent hydrolase (beta-lactamase superfamily II)